jgi:hypothetical protein
MIEDDTDNENLNETKSAEIAEAVSDAPFSLLRAVQAVPMVLPIGPNLDEGLTILQCSIKTNRDSASIRETLDFSDWIKVCSAIQRSMSIYFDRVGAEKGIDVLGPQAEEFVMVWHQAKKYSNIIDDLVSRSRFSAKQDDNGTE